AQEVSHFLLHRDLLDHIRNADEALELHNSLTDPQYEQLEHDANWCAGAILMPQHQFRDAAHDAYELWFRRIRSKTDVASPDFLLKRVVDDLAKHYRVSSVAAKIRLRRWPIKLYDDILRSAQRGQPFIGTASP
ncbi:MAG: ImmA/IrrE family metallo-endopeptidase, partial [Phycisphaerae bacterium]|nr:ImmA/IrrE family metallo-endopeptidase [Phycisphaerae bacterium]